MKYDHVRMAELIFQLAIKNHDPAGSRKAMEIHFTTLLDICREQGLWTDESIKDMMNNEGFLCDRRTFNVRR